MFHTNWKMSYNINPLLTPPPQETNVGGTTKAALN